ncbi:MAG TPA: glycosyltransferase family 4 protein [Steroidobacteraceae bacterium]
MSRLAPCRSVLMVGTDLDGTGGIRAVVCGYIDAGLFDRYRCTYVATHRPGSVWTKAAMALGGWWRVARALATLDAPLVHIQTASRSSFWRKSVVCLLARAARRPYLLHVHGGEFMKFYGEESSRLVQRVIRHTLAHAALVIALSEEWRERLQTVSPTACVEVVPNGVRLPEIPALRQPRGREPSLLFVGDLIRAKGTYDLLHAFALVAGRFPHLKLTCAGGGDVDAIRRLAEEHDLQQRVACPGWLGPERLRAELAGAGVFALPSYAEGMPMALLEAMSWGLPVIATPVGGVPQVIEHEVNGLLVGPGDIDGLATAIERLMGDAALRERLGAAARRTIATRFSLDVTLDRLGEVYRRFGLEPREMTRGRRPARAGAKAGSMA